MVLFNHVAITTSQHVGRVVAAPAGDGDVFEVHYFDYFASQQPKPWEKRQFLPLWWHGADEHDVANLQRRLSASEPRGYKPWIDAVHIDDMIASKFSLDSSNRLPADLVSIVAALGTPGESGT